MEKIDIFYIIYLISLAEFYIQSQISDLSIHVKRAMLFTYPYSTKLEAISKIVFWKKLFGKWWWIATPFIILVNVHKFFNAMSHCAYCLGFWGTVAFNLFFMHFTLLNSLLLSPLALVFIAILYKFHE